MNRLRLPNITEPTPEGQVKQVVAFLRLLVNDLNAVLDEIEMNQAGGERNGK